MTLNCCAVHPAHAVLICAMELPCSCAAMSWDRLLTWPAVRASAITAGLSAFQQPTVRFASEAADQAARQEVDTLAQRAPENAVVCEELHSPHTVPDSCATCAGLKAVEMREAGRAVAQGGDKPAMAAAGMLEKH